MEAAHGHQHGYAPARIARWITTTNHKDIGTLYLVFSGAMFLVGGIMALIIRTELFQPGLQYVEPDFYNSMVTYHGLIMIFGAIMPAFVGLANWLIPMQIGAPDMAFPRLNNWSFWLLPAAALLLIIAVFAPGGGAQSGWTLYPPLSVQQPVSMDLTIFAVHILGMSSILGAINIITTILNMRAPGMILMRMPMFCWTWLNRLPADRRDAGAGRDSDHAAHRPALRHALLQPGRRRRPGAVPAPVLVLRPS